MAQPNPPPTPPPANAGPAPPAEPPPTPPPAADADAFEPEREYYRKKKRHRITNLEVRLDRVTFDPDAIQAVDVRTNKTSRWWSLAGFAAVIVIALIAVATPRSWDGVIGTAAGSVFFGSAGLLLFGSERTTLWLHLKDKGETPTLSAKTRKDEEVHEVKEALDRMLADRSAK